MKTAKNSKELANAVYDDFKRKAVDEAKKRAVLQRVDYETFKNMVLVAHLKPIHAPNERQNDKMMPSWNFGVDGKHIKDQVESMGLPATTPVEAPSTSGDFYRDWRRNCPTVDDKYRYLKLCGPEVLKKLFKVEVNAEVLKDLISVLGTCWLSHAGAAEEAAEAGGSALREAAFVIQVLEAVSSAGRFSLAMKLVGSGARPVLQELFTSLRSAVEAGQAAADASEEGATEASLSGLCSAEQLDAIQRVYS